MFLGFDRFFPLATCAVLATVFPGIAAGQQCSGQEGSLDVMLTCRNCSVGRAETGHWSFSTEPTITSVGRSPAAEGLRPGDVIVSIDGMLITSSAGGQRYSTLKAGEPVTLVVRRDGSLVSARYNTVPEECPRSSRGGMAAGSGATGAFGGGGSNASSASSASGRAAGARGQGGPDRPVLASNHSPRATFGFAITCSGCWLLDTDGDGAAGPIWSFTSSPEVYSVEPGSAAERAGMRRGDVITQIDGIEVTRPEAGMKFGSAHPGTWMGFTVRRGNTTHLVWITAQRPTNPTAVPAAASVSPAEKASTVSLQPIRYAGRLGDTDVEVRGSRQVVVDYSDDEIIIVSGDTTVRLKRR